jgi:transposase-like protein
VTSPALCLAPNARLRKGAGVRQRQLRVWTWVALDADTKLVPTDRIGGRDLGEAASFMRDLAGRLASRVQLTTDGHRAYLLAVEAAFDGDVDYAQLIKVYGRDDSRKPERRFHRPSRRRSSVSDHVWTLDEIVARLDQAERAVKIKRGPYKRLRLRL